jgi:hypothetical protein
MMVEALSAVKAISLETVEGGNESRNPRETQGMVGLTGQKQCANPSAAWLLHFCEQAR